MTSGEKMDGLWNLGVVTIYFRGVRMKDGVIVTLTAIMKICGGKNTVWQSPRYTSSTIMGSLALRSPYEL